MEYSKLESSYADLNLLEQNNTEHTGLYLLFVWNLYGDLRVEHENILLIIYT